MDRLYVGMNKAVCDLEKPNLHRLGRVSMEEEVERRRFVMPRSKRIILFPKPSHAKLRYAFLKGRWKPYPASVALYGCRPACILSLVKVHRCLRLGLLDKLIRLNIVALQAV